jgi:hypothetical protein
MPKGIFEFEVGEPKRKRGFKFGTYAFAVACEREACSLEELLIKLGLDGGGRKNVSIMTLINTFYGTAVHYSESQNQKIDFKPSDVSDWIDEMGLEATDNMLRQGFEQYQPKN